MESTPSASAGQSSARNVQEDQKPQFPFPPLPFLSPQQQEHMQRLMQLSPDVIRNLQTIVGQMMKNHQNGKKLPLGDPFAMVSHMLAAQAQTKGGDSPAAADPEKLKKQQAILHQLISQHQQMSKKQQGGQQMQRPNQPKQQQRLQPKTEPPVADAPLHQRGQISGLVAEPQATHHQAMHIDDEEILLSPRSAKMLISSVNEGYPGHNGLPVRESSQPAAAPAMSGNESVRNGACHSGYAPATTATSEPRTESSLPLHRPMDMLPAPQLAPVRTVPDASQAPGTIKTPGESAPGSTASCRMQPFDGLALDPRDTIAIRGINMWMSRAAKNRGKPFKRLSPYQQPRYMKAGGQLFRDATNIQRNDHMAPSPKQMMSH